MTMDAVPVSQEVLGPLTRAAIFLVATIKPESYATMRSFCGDLSGLVRAVEFRDIDAGLTCIASFGSDAWDQLLNTNLRGVYYMVRAFAPMMIRARSGHIINISSLAGKNILPEGAAYSASKWGLNGLTYSVAEELRQYNVRASVIAPGSVNTGFGGSGSTKDRTRMVQPDDLARVVAMLVTQPPNSFVSEVLLRPTMKP